MPDPAKKNSTATVIPPNSAKILPPQIANLPVPSSIKAELRVEKIPEFRVSTGIDYVAFGGFVITALIVAVTTILTIKSATKTVSSQEKIARDKDVSDIEKLRAEKRADNRQEWINTLRSDLAAYVGAAMNTWNLHQMSAGRQSLRSQLTAEQVWEESSKWSYEYNSALRELEKLKAKIKLLLNPSELPSIELVRLINVASDAATSGFAVISACESIVSASQPILKDEWIKVKELR
jgi:hypothetical protein